MINPPRLACENIAAAYNSRVIFESFTLSLQSGLFALRGANGTGKSTLLRILAGAQRPARGQIRIAGTDLFSSPEQAKRQLSYVPDTCPAYPFMTGNEFLRFVATAKQTTIDRQAREMISLLSLSHSLDTRFDAMSLGTQKKIMLCAAWIGTPEVLLLDEPTNGLDASARAHFAALTRHSADRHVLLFSTHDDEFISESDATVLEMDTLRG
ncbi:ABC transporter ATP-binding protein [Acetobacter oeni]|uniref:ABC transporter domain-containing protein n=1 Tax=Acetobacter oeni TaxID=304077 RepID=A0A511XFT2_9PROT|nr:ATP-binding cassette domain-containing protein [Acetobacter oeni]MBB3882281.1 heme-transporting ATPase [Acetobacter oeni]NHO18034.1 ATP-binding cassette domain-containing protein [Acetobacter oeni]GBR01120.1 ABC transporter ATP-binding protein [Acetobacter oeni LMG 21952]GEN61799.1 hypothetical protein AOE01nite_00230 [Acetobacter oeni]